MDFAGKRVLVKNAGVGDTAPIEEMTVEAWVHTLNVNLRDTYFCIKYADDGGVLSPAFETCLTAFYANMLEAFGDEQRRDGSP